MNIFKVYRKIPLLLKLLTGMLIGVALGIVFGEKMQKIQVFGTLFLNLLKMACIPLIIVNLISGISSLEDPKMFGRVGIKIMIYYMFTTVLAAVWGIAGGMIMKPGMGLTLSTPYAGDLSEVPNLVDTLVGMVPSNIFKALSEGTLDQIVVFSAFAGVAVLMCKDEDRKKLSSTFSSLANMFNRLVGIVMGYAPFGVCALISCVVGVYGKSMFGPALKYIIAMAICFFVHWSIYFLILFVTTGEKPLAVIKESMKLVAITCSTSSSLAAVPVNMECAEKLNCSRSIFGFTIPLGSQMNKDGNAIMMTMSLLFAAQAANISLSLPTLINATIIALLLTTGAGGIPGGALVTIAIIIDAFSLPVDVVAIISGVFFILDLLNTTLNCYGDLIGTIIVDRSEKRRMKKQKDVSFA